MTSADFLAAQQRLAARRHAREAAAQAEVSQARGQRLQLSGLDRLRVAGGEAWSRVRGREGTRPAFRVGQVDAEQLDEELLELLKGHVGDGLKYFGSHLRDDWSAEIMLVLRTMLFKLSVWDHDATYGAALQNLKYSDARRPSSVHVSPSRWQKSIYGLVTVGGRYAWGKWEDWLAERESGLEEPSASVGLLSRTTSLISTTHSIAALISFLVFLVNGRYRTILDRVLRLRLISPNSQISREVSFEYQNRQLVWHALTEFLLFVLPLVGISRWRRWLNRLWRRVRSFGAGARAIEDADEKSAGELSFLPERTCAICYQDQNPSSTSETDVLAASGASGGVVGSAQTDITNPYEAIPCGCIYCFVCVAQRLESEDGEGWICLRCGDVVKECRPWHGDVVEEASRGATQMAAGNSKRVGFVGQDEDRPETGTHGSVLPIEESPPGTEAPAP